MVGVVTEFTRASADTPDARTLRWYWPHSSGLCHLAAWWPTTSFQDAKVAIFVHGGNLGNNPGWGSMLDQLNEAKNLALAQALLASGWVVVSIDYPVTSIYRHQISSTGTKGAARILGSWAEIFPLAQWPEQPAYVALAVQYIKTNASAVSGEIEGPFAEELWGAGNSIDPDNIWLIGDDWGAQLSLFAALQPTGVYKFDRIGSTAMDVYTPRQSHRVAGVIARNPGPLDFCQFHVRGTGHNAPTPYYLQNDRFHPFMRAESFRRWSTIPMALKRINPWFSLKANHIENSNLKIYTEFENNGTDASASTNDADLDYSDWNPGVAPTDLTPNAGTGRQWLMPDDGRIQAAAWREALQQWSYPDSLIAQSIVRDNTPNSSDPIPEDQSIWLTEVFTFMTR